MDDKQGNAALQESLLNDEIHIRVEDQVVLGGERGTKQEPAFHDVWAALLFGAQNLVLVFLALRWGVPSLRYQTYDSQETVIFSGAVYLALLSGLVSVLLASTALSVLVHVAEKLVQFSLMVSLSVNSLLVLLFLIEGSWIGVVIFGLSLLWGILYANSVWKRIPFAAANLQTAIAALQNNQGIFIVAIGATVLNFLWCMLWVLALVGVFVKRAGGDCHDGACENDMDGGLVVAFLLSFYWTSEVFRNVLHVTVAGVVGTFYFSPEEANHFCSPAIPDSLGRATTFSLGSICMGSLLTAILQVLYHLLRESRRQREGSAVLLCVLECIVGCLERLVAYFNKWAYIYIGLYGYDYLTAGRKVVTLFQNRGWSTVISDDLVARALGWVALLIGGLTGCFGVLLASLKSSWVEEFGGSTSGTVAFVIPFLIGLALAFIMMGVVASAVDTIIVCFAEAPADGERNHPGLYASMLQAWREVYPDSVVHL